MTVPNAENPAMINSSPIASGSDERDFNVLFPMAGNSCSKSHRLNASSSFLFSPRLDDDASPSSTSGALFTSRSLVPLGRAHGINTRPRREFALEAHPRRRPRALDSLARETEAPRRPTDVDAARRPRSPTTRKSVAARMKTQADDDSSRATRARSSAGRASCFSMGTKAKTLARARRRSAGPSFVDKWEK